MNKNSLTDWFDSEVFNNIEHQLNHALNTVFGQDFFDGLKDSGFPVADAYTVDGYLNIVLPVAGVDPKNINISEKDEILTIEGYTEKRSQDANHHLKEWKRGKFVRRFNLPEGLEGEPDASLKNGVLTVKYKLAEPEPEVADEPKNIKINVE